MTNGIVSIVFGSPEPRVIVKIVVGDDGYNAKKVATAIRALRRVPEPEELHALCEEHRFGCWECRVVLTETSEDFRGSETSGLDPDYRRTFGDPSWNPRWARGTAPHVEIVDANLF